jgi:GDP-4-dehydro-6-deoxy-D-mannose reductase
MSALITGITGFVGGHLAEHLLGRGEHVVGCDLRGSWPEWLEHLAGRAELIELDLSRADRLHSFMRCYRFERIYHLAGLADPRACQRDPSLAWRHNVKATEYLCEAIVRSAPAARLLLVSSVYVYGRPGPEQMPLGTDCPVSGEHPYAASKLAAEQLAFDYAEQCGLDVVIVRPFNQAGPRQPRSYLIADWSAQVAEMELGLRERVLAVGNLATRRDYTDVRDAVRAYRMLLERAPSRSLYNLGSGRAVSGHDILGILKRLSRVQFRVETDPSKFRDDAPLLVADIGPIRSGIGWEPQIAPEQTVADTLQFWRRQLGSPGSSTE